MFMTVRRTYLPSITTPTCSKAADMEPLLPATESLKRDKIKTICL